MPEFFISTFWFICYILFLFLKNRSHRFCFPCSILAFQKYPTLVDKTSINRQHFPPCHFWRTQGNAFSEHLSFCITDVWKVPNTILFNVLFKIPTRGQHGPKIGSYSVSGLKEEPIVSVSMNKWHWLNIDHLSTLLSQWCTCLPVNTI